MKQTFRFLRLYDLAMTVMLLLTAPVIGQAQTPATIVAVSGGGQTTQEGSYFSNPLVAKVTDSSNNPVVGVAVTFSGAGIANQSVFTDASGMASTGNLLATGPYIGGYTVSANVAGVANGAYFGLNNSDTACSETTTVTTYATDASPYTGTLRQAVADVCTGGTVDLSGVPNGTVITLTNRIYFNRDVTINGPSSGTVTIDGGSSTRLFFVQSGTIAVNNLTLAHGLGQGGNSYYGGGGAGMGGAIFQNGGTVALTNVTLNANQARGGSALDDSSGSGGGGFADSIGSGNNGENGGDLGGSGGMAAMGRGAQTGGNGGDGAGGGTGTSTDGGTGTGGNGGFGGGAGVGVSLAPGIGVGGFGGFGGGGGTVGGWGGASSGAGLGGAIFIRSGSIALTAVTFTNNSAIGDGSYLNGQGKGGALFLYSGATATLNNVTFGGNMAAAAGQPGIGFSAAPYSNGKQCPGNDNVNVCGAVPSISTAAADGTQTTLVNTAFTALSVKVTDVTGNPVASGNVTFSAPATGAAGLFSNNTNTITVPINNGVATATFTANTVAGGPYTVTAAVNGFKQNFSLTNQCASSVPVTNTNDSGTGSLRASLAGTCPGGTVDLSGFPNATTFTLLSRLYLNQDITINGPSAATVTIDGGSATRLFFVQSGNIAINNLTLAHGLGQGGNSYYGGGGAGMGGAIFQNGGTVSLTNVTLNANQAAGGSSSIKDDGGGGGGFGGNAPSNGNGASGGDLGGTGGAYASSNGANAIGGNGGDGAGGGEGTSPAVATGGNGGFGGGGGADAGEGPFGGNGGFGGGGGNPDGAGGWGGGSSGTGGGGGAGFGGAIFERTGTLNLTSVVFAGNSTTGGASYDNTNNGQAKGGALFVYSGATANLTAVTFSGNVAANAGQAGIGSSTAPYTTGAQCPGEDSVDVCGVTNNAVTINTNPTGLSFSVDGASATTPQTETWASGSSHILSITSPQSNEAFTSWSDGTTTTTDNVTARRTVTSYTANFKLNTVQVTISTTPAGLSFTVDGTTYTTSQTLTWTIGTNHTIATTSPQAGAAGTQYVFTSWSDGGALSHLVTAATATTSYTASFKTQYLLTTAASPSAFGTVSAGAYFDAGSTPTVIATPNPNYQFLSWTGPVASATSASTTVSMSGPESVTANFAGSAGFVTSQTPGPLRNNYTGFVGMEFTVGSTPSMAYYLGRYVVSGDNQTHIVKLVQANGTDVPGGSVNIVTSNAAPGAYKYVQLPNPITLLANTSYFLVSQETAGGDQWYDYGPVSTASIATVVGPTYVDGYGHYVPVTTLPGRSYVPVNFLYAPPTTSLSVNITSPAANATLTGTASISVTTTGPVTGLQVQVDGVNQGTPVPVSVNNGPSYTLSLNTTVLSVGSHSLTVVATDATNDSVTSPPVTVTVSNAPGNISGSAFVLSQTPGALRNNYTGFVGMSLRIGSTPVVVTSLGRLMVAGNTGKHLLKLVNSDGSDVPGGSVSVSMAGGTPGTFVYGALPAGPFTLQSNTSYFLVSQETLNGDQWYDFGPVTTSVVASVVGPAYTDGFGNYVTVGGLGGDSYVPPSFLYGPTANTISAAITSPANGALIGGASVPVSVSVTGTVTSYQLQVDGTNFGAPSSTSPLTLDTTTLTNGQHTLAVVVSEGVTANATSPGIIVTVNNPGTVFTAFTTGQSARALRNNYTGYVGMTINVGPSPISVVSLGRYVVSGNSGTHILKIVQANGTPVTNGSATLNLSGATAGTYAYAALPATVTLAANTTYYLVSQEVAGGDMWYDLEPVTTTGVAQVAGPTYTDGGGNYVTVSGFPGYSYVPLSLQYQ